MKTAKTNGLSILATQSELNELEAAGCKINAGKASIVRLARSYNGRTILKRTFNMAGYKFWRVMGPVGHPSLGSDLSLDGLRDWGIIAPKGF